MKLLRRFSQTLRALPAARKVEHLLDQARIALALFIATLIVMLISFLIISTYFLVHLVQGR